MGSPLATTDDVADLWRPLTTDEAPKVERLIGKASAKLRQKVPWVDARIARFNADPTDLGGLDPDVVADVVANIVKRFLVNPDGATNTSESVGPFSRSKGFALRGDKDVRGEIIVTDTDIEALTPAIKTRARLASTRVKPLLAPGRGSSLVGADAAGVPALLQMDAVFGSAYDDSAAVDNDGWVG